ncbi:MAG: GNAT family N-acetyltransferase [Sarcina sp.]
MNFEYITDKNVAIAARIFMNSFNSEPWFEKWTEETGVKRLSQIMRCEGSVGLIGYQNNEPCAMIVGHEEDYYDGTRFLIKEFCVDSGCKGGGVGTKVLKHYVETLKSKEVVHISLYTMREKRVVNFYEKNGFKEIEDLVMMELI